MKIIGLTLLLSCIAVAAARPIIIDTDAGSDDLMAIAYLLARQDVHIEAITVISGVANVHAGARNILRLLELAGKRIPVYEGPAATQPGGHSFPEDWKKVADNLPSIDLPQTKHKAESQTAAQFLAARLRQTQKPVSILAIGPLTNIAAAFAKYPQGIHTVTEMVIMGGAFRVAGNVENTAAEWNMFADPLAARKVFESGVPIHLIPLDATNKVPIDKAYAAEFKSKVTTHLGKVTAQLLESSRELMESHLFFAWDPLAAIAMLHPEVVTYSAVAISVQPNGAIKEAAGPAHVQAALDANSTLFHKLFLIEFTQ